jgi:serine/threonine-protein kinase
MGEVYRARDAKLDRDVAIKVLPAAFTADAERLARFEREARLLASLNHSNIAHVYGFESAPLADASSVHFLAMELVEGEDLSDRLKRGAIPLDEALAIAKQIAEALEEAHEHGIVHRDLKPANVKVTADGKVKVLDFGLAKAYAAESSVSGSREVSHSPTLSRHMTEAGMILGTAAYMAPEQARGKAVDKRADIWAFGVVLYEMLTGKRLFTGETASDVLAGVLKTEIDLAVLPAQTPAGIRRVLHGCLERNPKNRLHDIADARIAIDEASLAGGPETAALPAVRRGLGWLPWAIAAASAALAVLALVSGRPWLRPSSGAAEVLRLQLVPAQGERLSLNDEWRAFATSPDGSKIVYAVESGPTSELRLRALDSDLSTSIPGTEQGAAPFFSPDGKWIGFAAGAKLKKVALAGGAPVTLADAPFFRGAVWGEDGSIYFVPNTYVPISRMPAAGGAAQPVTAIRTTEGEVQHRWPELLPGGKVLLYVIGLGGEWDEATIVAQRLDSGERKVLVRGGTSPRYLPTGQLVYARAGGLYAVTLDPRSLEVTGPPVEVARNVFAGSPGWAAMDVSRTGLLVTVSGDSSAAGASVLSWVDREGRGEPLKLPAASYSRVVLSPAGDRAVLSIHNQVSVMDLARLSISQLTLAGRAEYGTWARDGRRVLFGYERGKHFQIYAKAADDTGEPELVVSSNAAEDPGAVSRDGSRLLGLRFPLDGKNALLVHDLSHPRSEPLVIFQSSNMYWGYSDFSPDGRFVVYQTEESGRPEIYVRAASGEDRRWQVSNGGGTAPVWSAAGDEIFFLSRPKLMAAKVRTSGGEPVVGEPRVLFANRRVLAFDAARDGRRFLIAEDPNPGAQPRLDVVVHWFAAVERKLAEARTP